MKISNINQNWIRRFLFLLICGAIYLPVSSRAGEALSIDREQLKSALHEEISGRIREAIESNVESLQDAAEDKIYQQVKAIIKSQIDTEKIQEMIQTRVDQVLEANPRVKMLVEDYKNERSQQVIGDLQTLYGEAQGQLTEILNSLNAYQAEEEPSLEHFKKLEELGFKGRWVDKIGEWEAFYERQGASIVEDLQTLHGGFSGGEPGGQLLAMFTLMEKYSDKVPGLGRFVKLYAQVGKEMLAAAIRAGELIRQRDQGCLGEGTHSGIKNWYNLGDPVNIAFTQTFGGQTACPTAFDNIFRNEDDQSVLYFWTGEKFLVGEAGNGGSAALVQIIAFLQSAEMANEVKDMSILQKFYNANFPMLKELVQTMLDRISQHLERLKNVRLACGEEAYQNLITELGQFTVTPELFEERKPKIFQRMIISQVLEDGTAFDTYDKAEIALNLLYAMVIRGQVYTVRNGEIATVPDATVKPTFSGGRLFAQCQQLTTDENGKYQMVILLDKAEVPLKLQAQKDELKSEPKELMLDRVSFYRDGVNLQLKAKTDTTRVPKAIAVSPTAADLAVGETQSFAAELEYADGTVKNITNSATWNGGNQNSFTGTIPGEATLTASFFGLSGSAKITVKCPEDRPEWNSELGECTSLESAIDSLAEEPPEDFCNENNMKSDWAQIQQWVAEALNLESRFNAKYFKFLKELNDQNANACKNDILAVAYAGSKSDQALFEILVDQVQAMTTNLILQLGMCPDLSLDLGVKSIVQTIAQLGPPRRRIGEGLAEMQSLLAGYGCDEEEITERGEQVAENTTDPNVIDDGGAGGTEICGDGKDNDGDGLIDEGCESQGNYNVALYLYDSGSAKDDVFSLSVSGVGEQGTTPEGGARTYPLYLSPGTYTATVTVISAPDDVGTFTLTVKEGDVVIASESGSPPQGSQTTVVFTVGQLTPGPGTTIFMSTFDFGPEIEVIAFPNERNLGNLRPDANKSPQR